jgi:hypothetical protein
MSNQEIRCHVQTCKHNQTGNNCVLHDITVGNIGSQARDKADTECDSFSAQ